MKTFFLFLVAMIMGMGTLAVGGPSIANAYSIYPTTGQSTQSAQPVQSSSLNFDTFNNFSVASGLNQLAAPFQNFVANVQSDTTRIAVLGTNPVNVLSSTTLPLIDANMSADAENYFSEASNELSNWFYGTIGTEIFNWTAWVRAKV